MPYLAYGLPVERFFRLDDQVVNAHLLDQRHDLLPRARPDREHGNHRSHAENHSQHGQQLIADGEPEDSAARVACQEATGERDAMRELGQRAWTLRVVPPAGAEDGLEAEAFLGAVGSTMRDLRPYGDAFHRCAALVLSLRSSVRARRSCSHSSHKQRACRLSPSPPGVASRGHPYAVPHG